MMTIDHPVKSAATEWAARELPHGDSLPSGWLVDRATWKKAGDFGVLGSCLPERHGGRPLSPVALALTLEGMGASPADNGVVFAIATQSVAANRAIGTSGTPAQLQQWGPLLAGGDAFLAFAMSEPNSGSHPWSMETRARPESDGSWTLDGVKQWVTLAPIADAALVFAVTDPALGQWGITAFIVNAETAGFSVSEPVPKMGLQACPWGEITLESCRVPADAVLGRVGSGAAIFSNVVESERAFLYASQLGAAERLLNHTVDRARSRTQGGVHIGSHQAVAHRLVEMKLHHEAARLLLYKAAECIERGVSSTLPASLAKLMATTSTTNNAIDSMRTFGAYGYTEEAGVEREVRDALAGLAFSGTADVTRNIVAGELGLNRRTPAPTEAKK